MMELKNKGAVITGVSRGIGFATAQVLLNHHVAVAGNYLPVDIEGRPLQPQGKRQARSN